MSFTSTHLIHATNLGQAKRHELQQHTLIALLWERPQTREVVTQLTRATGLDHSASQLQRAVKEGEPHDTIVSLDHALFEAILSHRERIGNTFSKYVRSIFGCDVPWVTVELVGLYVTQVQASALEGKPSRRSTLAQGADSTTEDMPVLDPRVLAVLPRPEADARLRQFHKAQREALRAQSRGRVPQQKEDVLHDYTRWYYLYLIEGRSVRSLSKEYMARARHNTLSDNYDGRALIQHAIRETAGRLNLPVTRLK